MNRRELFSSFGASLKGEAQKSITTFLRPPYFKDEALFLKECPSCENKCDTVCEEEIIKITEDGSPYIVFGNTGCTFCDKCAEKCDAGVLDIKYKQDINAKIEINQSKCLSWNHTMCFSCKDPCLDKAIDFKAMFMAEINDNCTSCGFCISRCPVDAIEIKVLKNA